MNTTLIWDAFSVTMGIGLAIGAFFAFAMGVMIIISVLNHLMK